MQKEEPRKLRLIQRQCPGDVCVLTASIESLHKTYPGQYLTDVQTNHNELFTPHPLITRFKRDEKGVQDVVMHYNSINQSHIPHHFMDAYCRTLSEAIGRPLSLKTNRPHLYITPQERDNPLVSGPYAIVNAGYKDDYATKWAGTELYQSVVDAHKDRITWVQVGAEPNHHHHHPRLQGVTDMVNKTSLRELLRLCAGASLGIGGITCLSPIMAAFQRPYVCVLGGREPLSWVTYPTQITLNTLGLLPCCRLNACWKSHMAGADHPRKCVLPTIDAHGCCVPQCLAMLRTAAVDAVGVLLDGVKS